MAHSSSQSHSRFSWLFWPVMILVAAGTAGGIYAFVFAEVGGNGWRQGAFLGALVFVVAAFLFGRLMVVDLPPPNTVRIDVPPAPTVPRSRSDSYGHGASSSPSPAAERVSAGVDEIKGQAMAAAAKLREAVEQGTEKLTGGRSDNDGAESAEARETPATSPRVTDAARKAGEAARMMDEPAPAPVPAPANETAPVVSPEPVRPLSLSSPREGGADDLKRIKGVGPKLEEMLHGLGFYHFDQIADWGPGEIAWVDSNLDGFNGRATRDDWVGQAKVLAAGGETEFSERVDRGDVYDT